MSDKTREEFEEVCDSLPVKITNNEKAVAQYIWTTQQKKIDELEADNPQVECIECGGYGFTVKGGAEHHPQCNGDCSIYGCPIDGRCQELCPSCQGLGKISKVKEQDLIIKELQAQLNEKGYC